MEAFMKQKIIQTYYENINSDKAEAMKKYTRNQFEYIGISKSERKIFDKAFHKSMKNESTIDWDLVNLLWDLPEREFQYLAIDYLIPKKKYLQVEDISQLRKLILTKSWWDTVDMIASQLVGELGKKYPQLIISDLIEWSQSENYWLRRTAILFQLKYKENLDKELLEEIIGYNKDSKEFFIAKAIGWILREYSKTNPEWVKEFLERSTLQNLSVREASKYI